MKKFNVPVFLVLCVALLSGCALSKMIKLSEKQKIKVTPSPLEVHGEKITYDVGVVLPPKMLPKGKTYTLKFSYKTDNGEQEVGELLFSASDYPNSKKIPSRQERQFSLDYGESLKRGELWVQGVAANPATGKSKSTKKAWLTEGVVTTSHLASAVRSVSYADHGYNDQEELEERSVAVYFEQGRSRVRKSELRSTRVRDFDAFISQRNKTRRVSVVGSHSPEGTEAINTGLAEARGKVVEKWYRKRLERYDYKDLAKDILFEREALVRDWGPFKRALKDYSGVPKAQKREILAVVNGVGTFEDKELALQKFPIYKKIAKELYPDLRVARAVIWTVKEKRSNEEIVALSLDKKGRTELSGSELLFAATFTPSLKEKLDIYKTAIAKDESWAAHNNTGAAMLELSEGERGARKDEYITKAITHLEIASKSAGSPKSEVLGNLAVAYLIRGNVERAYDNLTKAVGLRPSQETLRQINAVKGTIELKRGDYENAALSYQTVAKSVDVQFNQGLLSLLTKDYNEAERRFNLVTKAAPSYAKAHYGLAVKSALVQDESGVERGLKRAVQYDGTLKERAIGDIIFKDYPEILKKL